MDKPTREPLTDLMAAPTGNEKSYRQLVREGRREPGILMLSDREHHVLTRAVLDQLEAGVAGDKKT